MAIWCDICANCSAYRFPGLARSAFFDATPPMSVPALVGWETALSRFLAKTGNPFSEHGQFSRFYRGFSRAYVRALSRFSFFAFTVCMLSVDI